MRRLTAEESAQRWDAYSLAPLRKGHALRHLADSWRYRLPLYWEIQKRVPAGGRILEVGTGSGAHLLWLAAHGFQTTGVDYRPPVIEAARELATRLEIDAEFAVADAFDLSAYHDYDLAFSVGMIEHWDRPKTVEALVEQARAARVVVAEIPTPHTRLTGEITDERFYSRADVRRLLRDAGLTDVQVTAYGDLPTRWGRFRRLAIPPWLLQGVQRRSGRLAMSLVGMGRSGPA